MLASTLSSRMILQKFLRATMFISHFILSYCVMVYECLAVYIFTKTKNGNCPYNVQLCHI